MAEKCGGILGGGGSGGAPPGFGPTGNTDTPAEIFKPYASGTYYGETFAFSNKTNETGTSGAPEAETKIGPLYCGGPRSWDRIGCTVRFSSSPGTPPGLYYVIYGLVTDTLFPEVLLFQGAVQTNGVTLAFIEETISVRTSHKWIGIGWHCDGVGGETYAIRAGGDVAAAGNSQGYIPYGCSRVTTTLTPNLCLFSTATVGTTTAGAPGTFTTTRPVSGIQSSNTGVYIRQA